MQAEILVQAEILGKQTPGVPAQCRSAWKLRRWHQIPWEQEAPHLFLAWLRVAACSLI